MIRNPTYRGVVYPWHCDHVGHMNVMWYVGKFDEATWNLFSEIGLTPAYLRDRGRGMAALEQHLRYLKECRAGDVVVIDSRIVEFKPKTLRFVHEMRDGETGEACASCELTAAHLDTVARKAVPFPPEVIATLEQAIG